MVANQAPRLLVPVQRSVTLRQTVDYAMQQVLESDAENGEPTVHFVFMATWRADDPGTETDRQQAADLLEQIEIWARYECEEADVDPETVAVETAMIGLNDYLFSPVEYAELLTSYADKHRLDRVIVDPEYSLVGHTTLLQPLEFELQQTELAIEEAPVDRPTRRDRLVSRTSPVRFIALFGVSFLFYQILGGFSGLFDLVTGVATAGVVAITLSSVSFYHDPSFAESPKRVLRGLVYVPYLLYEIIVSNLVVARVILDPTLEIDPRMTRVRVFVGSGFPLTTLANSITLTPGTLTVTADDQDLYVHSLVPFAREGLFDGSLERWVRFVFYGREAARFPSPRERGDTEVLQEPDTADPVVVDDESDSHRSDGHDSTHRDGGDDQ
jgi:multicomponent Na+:H+ antiporter subunit E